MALRFMRLERAAIRKLQAGEKIMEHGITAERLSDGDLRWTANIMVDGKRIHRVIGKESDGVTRQTCVRFIETQRTAAREDRLSLPNGRKTHLGFRGAAADYLQKLEATGGKNLAQKERHFRKMLIPFFKDQRLSTLTSFTIGQYKKHRRDEGAAGATINRELATLSHLLNKAVEWNWLRAKPVAKFGKEPESRGRIIALTDAE